MFDVSDANYLFMGFTCMDISVYLFILKVINLFVLVIATVFQILMLDNDSTPFFFVWVAGMLVWFFLDMASSAAHFFNAQHSMYLSKVKYVGILLSSIKLRYYILQKNYLLQLTYARILV